MDLMPTCIDTWSTYWNYLRSSFPFHRGLLQHWNSGSMQSSQFMWPNYHQGVKFSENFQHPELGRKRRLEIATSKKEPVTKRKKRPLSLLSFRGHCTAHHGQVRAVWEPVSPVSLLRHRVPARHPEGRQNSSCSGNLAPVSSYSFCFMCNIIFCDHIFQPNLYFNIFFILYIWNVHMKCTKRKRGSFIFLNWEMHIM